MSDLYVCIYKQGSMQDYRHYSNRTVDEIEQKKFNFVNPIMQKAAPLIIFD